MKSKKLCHAVVLMLTLSWSSLLLAETVWVDVRTSLEHKLEHIEDGLRITHTDILQEASKAFPDKDMEIKLYCRSGRRAGIALSALKEAGYTNVHNVGSIGDARAERGFSD